MFWPLEMTTLKNQSSSEMMFIWLSRSRSHFGFCAIDFNVFLKIAIGFRCVP